MNNGVEGRPGNLNVRLRTQGGRIIGGFITEGRVRLSTTEYIGLIECERGQGSDSHTKADERVEPPLTHSRIVSMRNGGIVEEVKPAGGPKNGNESQVVQITDAGDLNTSNLPSEQLSLTIGDLFRGKFPDKSGNPQ